MRPNNSPERVKAFGSFLHYNRKQQNTDTMRKITYIVDIERENVRTIGATHSMKGNVDGNISFYEAGIDGLKDKDDIIEAFEEMNDCLPDQEKVDEIIVKFE